MRKPHGPATERRAKIVAVLREQLAIPESERTRRYDPVLVAARAAKVTRRTVRTVARAFAITLPRKVAPNHKVVHIDPARFTADLQAMGAARLARKLRCSPQAVYYRAAKLGIPLHEQKSAAAG